MTRKKGRKLVSDKPVARPPKLTARQQAREDRWSAEYMARVAAKMGRFASRAAQEGRSSQEEVQKPSKRRSGKLTTNSATDHLGKE